MLSRNIFENPSEENLKLVKITLPNKLENLKASRKNYNSWKALQLMCLQLPRVYCGHSASCFIYFLFQVVSEKKLCSKDFTCNMRNIFYESNCEYNVFKFCYEFAFIFLFSFRKNNKKKRIKFSVYIGGVVTETISIFCL